MTRRFYTLDVFADAPLQGNPLAVVLDADDLDSARMQAIAGEFNLSETVFVLEPRDSVNTARLRIFTPGRELPFAGHPTVGTACLIGHLRAASILARQDLRIVLEETIGDVVCVARRRPGQGLAATFDLPRLPTRLPGALPSYSEIAEAFDLAAEDIGFGDHRPSLYSAGAPFLFVPLRSREAIRHARPGGLNWPETPGPGAYLYTREVERAGSAFHARMFAGEWGIPEDPATGAAAAAFAGVVAEFERPGDGETTLTLEQGFEMGRPSLITLGMRIEGGALRGASIGGSAVIVSSGTLDL
jgi:trans-2,3-dihydro-3-hydroxyanthranilate isomerase